MKLISEAEKFAVAGRLPQWPVHPLLHGESAQDFDGLLEAFMDEVEPRGAIEDMYVRDMARIVWEMLRLHRARAAIINTGFCAAIEAVTARLLEHAGETFDRRKQRAAGMARHWFIGDRQDAQKLLNRFELDEWAFAADAMRRASPALEPFDKALASLEVRRDKTLACIAAYRVNFAGKVRAAAARMVDPESTGMPRLVDAGSVAHGEAARGEAAE